MKCNNCSCKVDEKVNFCPNCGNDILKQKDRKSKILALISFFMSLIPAIVIAYVVHVDSGCEASCLGGLYFIAYVWFAGIPVGVCTFVLGNISYVIKKNKLAIVDMVLGVLQVLAIVLFFILLRQ